MGVGGKFKKGNVWVILLGKKSVQIARLICLPKNLPQEMEKSPNTQQTEKVLWLKERKTLQGTILS